MVRMLKISSSLKGIGLIDQVIVMLILMVRIILVLIFNCITMSLTIKPTHPAGAA